MIYQSDDGGFFWWSLKVRAMKKKHLVFLAGLPLILVGCGTGDSGNGASGANEEGGGHGEVIVSSFGGDFDDFMQDSTHTHLEDYGGLTPVLAPVDAATRTTQLLTESDSDQGSWDVVALTDRDIPDMIDAGALAELDPERISNWDNIQDAVRHEHCVPQVHSPITFIYNTAEIEGDFSTWENVFTQEIFEQSGTGTNWSDYFYYASAMLAADGDPDSNLEPGYERVNSLADGPVNYGSPTQIGQGLMSGEVNATVGPRARAAQWTEDSGLEFATEIPDEGTYRATFYYCIPANASNMDGAYAYLDAILDERGQEYMAERSFYEPAVTNADLSPELAERIVSSEEENERIWQADLRQIADQVPDLRSMWNEHSN